MGEVSSWQLLINIVLFLVSFLGGWLLKVVFGLMSKMQEDYKDLHFSQQEEIKKLREDMTLLALSIPEKYVIKDDFKDFAERMDERFDKLEEKLDSFRR